MNKDAQKEPVVRRTGSVAAEDDDLTLWLNRLWARNEYPERIEIWQMFGRNKAVRGEMIFHEDFGNSKLDIEQVTRLANEMIAAAQNDCDVVRRETYYQIAVIDRNRKSTPLTRRLGPMQPKRTYALASLKEAEAEDMNDDELTPQQINRVYIKEAMEQSRWDKQRYDRVMGDMLLLQNNIIQRQQVMLDSVLMKYGSMFEKMNEFADRSLDREMLRDREKFKLGLYKDGFRTVRNLLPGLFAGGDGNGGGQQQQQMQQQMQQQQQQQMPSPSSNSEQAPQQVQGQVVNYGNSPERTLVDNFLTDIEEDEQLQIKLFGNYEEKDGKWALTQPGIFTFEQFRIFLGVREGKLPVERLDELLPQSGFPTSITQQQVMDAGAAGVSESIGIALMELVGLRNQAKQAKESKGQ